MDKLTIDRSKWRNASRGKGPTCLLNKEGYMCCLGFASLALGATPAEILGRDMPQCVSTDADFGPLTAIDKEGVLRGSEFSVSAMCVNDDGSDLSDAKRETLLIQLFGENGIALDFTGEYDGQIDN